MSQPLASPWQPLSARAGDVVLLDKISVGAYAYRSPLNAGFAKKLF